MKAKKVKNHKAVLKGLPNALNPKILVRVEKPKENEKVYSVECGRCPPSMF